MMKKIAIIMPTRSAGGIRNAAAMAAFDSWQKTTSGHSDFYYGLDTDDYQAYTVPAGARTTINERLRLVPKLNKMAEQLQDAYEYLFFIGDDHRFMTDGWEDRFLSDASSMGGIAIMYGNDMLQGAALPTAVFISTAITRALGFMAPGCIQHMYADNFWKDLGDALGILKYYPDIIVEHLHFSVKKSKPDAQYREVAALHRSDEAAYKQYLKNNSAADIERVRQKCGLP
jgi:hypothetical protein